MGKGKKNVQPIPRAPTQSPPNAAWDDLREFSQSVANIMGGAAQTVHLLATNQELTAQLKDKEAIAQKVSAIARDLKDYVRDYEALRAEHEGRKGAAKNEAEFIQTLNIAARYDEHINQFQNVVLPVVAEVNDAYLIANENLLPPPADAEDDGDATSTQA